LAFFFGLFALDFFLPALEDGALVVADVAALVTTVVEVALELDTVPGAFVAC